MGYSFTAFIDGGAVRWVAQEVPDKDIRAGRLWGEAAYAKTKILGGFLRHAKATKKKGIDLERQVAHFLCFRMTQWPPQVSLSKGAKNKRATPRYAVANAPIENQPPSARREFVLGF